MSEANNPSAPRSGERWMKVALWVLLLLGVAVRVLKAWSIRFAPNSDYGICALMARNMAEGTDFPVFFYGQAYMGSLEPALSAWLCRLAGFSPFMVCLGTVLAGLPLLPLTYLLGRRMGGRGVGLLALAMTVVGSDTTFHYAAAPRGGYMTMMSCGLAVLLLAAEIATRVGRGARVSGWLFWLAGVLAGLGWWSNQLVIVFLLAAVLTLLPALRWEWLRRGLFPALLAFFIGSLPWWWWNVTHEWGTFSFGGSMGVVPAREGAGLLTGLFWRLWELKSNAGPIWWLWPARATVAMLMAGFVWRVLLDLRVPTRMSVPAIHRRAAFWIAFVMIGLFITSHYARMGATRYLMPLLTTLAVACADRAMALMRYPRGWIVGVPIALLAFPSHWVFLPIMRQDAERDFQTWRLAGELADLVARLPGNVCYGDYGTHWINVASDGRLTVLDPNHERYAPFVRRAALADHPVYLMNYGGVSTFVEETGGRCRFARHRQVHVVHAFEPPSDAWEYTVPQGAASDPLLDGNLLTGWTADLDADPQPTREWLFDRPRRLVGVRLISGNQRWPPRVRFEARTDGASEWVEIMPPRPTRLFFWSAGLPRHITTQYYQEYRFQSPSNGVTALRMIVDRNDRRARPVEVWEALLMVEAASAEPPAPWPDDAGERLRLWGCGRVYAPSRYAERLAAQAYSGDIPAALLVSAPSSVSRDVQDPPRRDPPAPTPVALDARAAFIMDRRDAPRSRAALAALGIGWRDETLGGFVALLADPPTLPQATAGATRLYWTELGLFVGDRAPADKVLSHQFFLAAEGGLTGRARLAALGEAVRQYPGHVPAARALAEALTQDGQTEAATRMRAALAGKPDPQAAAAVRFGGGAELVALTIEPASLTPGGMATVEYRWRVPTNAPVERLSVNLQFRDADRQWCNDNHRLADALAGHDWRVQPWSETFVVRRTVALPPDLPAGALTLRLRLLDEGDRVRVRSSIWPVRRRTLTPALPLRSASRDGPA